MNQKQIVSTSKFLSLVLRHKPEEVGIALDAHGWADVSALLHGMNDAGVPCDTELLEKIVRTDEKQRYSFNADHTQIRANQGHSVAVNLELTQTAPPEYLWHGTASRFLSSIMREGLKPMSRQYVHLSPDMETAYKVGLRHGKPVILQIAAQKMVQDGAVFFISENGVWLTAAVPPQYISPTEPNGKGSAET